MDWRTGRVVWPEPIAVLTPDLLVEAIGCSRATAVRYAPHLTAACKAYGIDQSSERLAAFLAQTGHESASYDRQAESFDYAADRLAAVFGETRAALATPFARQPGKPADQPALAEAVYGGEWGARNLGNTQPGDGWRYRARGPIGTTGRGNYARLRVRLRARFGPEAPDFEANPDALEDPRWGALSAADYWDSRNCNALADRGDFEGITRAINGGMNGHADRLVRLLRARAALVSWQPAGATNAPAPASAPQPAPAAPPAASIPAGDAGAPEKPMAPVLIAIGKTFLGGLAAGLIEAFTPRAKAAVTKELERHGADSAAAGQIIGAVVDAAKAVTGLADPAAAVVAAKADPAIVPQVEADTLDTLDRLAPLLDKLAEWDKGAWDAEEASRSAAAERAHADGYDMAQPLLIGSFVLVACLIICVFAVIGVQMWKGSKVDTEVWAALTGLIGWATAKAGSIYDYRFGTSRSSAAKDVVIGELSRRKQ